MYKAVTSQPRKVRKKMIYNAPLHKLSKQLVAPLSDELRREYNIKRLRVRKGDTVMIVRGSFAGLEGKVVKVDVKKRRIGVEGATRTRSDGREIPVLIHPSKVIITKLDLSDKMRKQIIERKKPMEVTESEES
ncbi:MAG: 50S ribosomal protein L24 [Thermoproteales archaeon]|nr:50S ribosomal protein L24 [Thermoproteales archaeon]